MVIDFIVCFFRLSKDVKEVLVFLGVLLQVKGCLFPC